MGSEKQQGVNEAQAAIANLDVEMAEQKGKMQRAMSMAKQIVKLHRKDTGSVGEETDVELDFQLRQLKDFTGKVLGAMNELVERNPDIRPEVSMLYGQAGIKPPSTGRRTGGSSISSSSSVSSRVSARRTKPQTS